MLSLNRPLISLRSLIRNFRNIVGLIPAAGQASRIAPLPCSKELFPIGFRDVKGKRGRDVKVVSHYVLEKLSAAGVRRAYIVLREGKWDIPKYFGDGSALEMHLACLTMGVPDGPPYTLNQACPFIEQSFVAFGFPDILFRPDDAFVQLFARQGATRADLVLRLFQAHNSCEMDMVETAPIGVVRSIQIKPPVNGWNTHGLFRRGARSLPTSCVDFLAVLRWGRSEGRVFRQRGNLKYQLVR